MWQARCNAAVAMSTTAVRAPIADTSRHVFSVDVEEYFQVGAFERVVDPSTWDGIPTRLAEPVCLLLDILARFGARGTFFTLGWIAIRYPEIIRRIAEGGHEIASHGWSHRRATTLSPVDFRDEVRRSKAVLEDLIGRPVIGYRAPNFSIGQGNEWAYDVLLEEGYSYDSSVFPIRRPDYGDPDAPTEPYLIERSGGTLIEVPLATTTLLGARLPAAGGAYMRHFPYALIRRAFREHEARGVPAVFYVHPWELDPGQPRLDVSSMTHLRHYGGLRRTAPRIERLLGEFKFTSAQEMLGLCKHVEYQLPPAAAPLKARS
jgi:polysaccharide deacetylase family protein (PEP-CTERM system associated)